jgi:hypothetical protein
VGALTKNKAGNGLALELCRATTEKEQKMYETNIEEAVGLLEEELDNLAGLAAGRTIHKLERIIAELRDIEDSL